MAHSITYAKTLSSFVVHQRSLISSRGYASASQDGVSKTMKGSVVAMMKKGGEELTKLTAWVADPVTDYYKPEGHGNQVDATELRALLLKHKTQRN